MEPRKHNSNLLHHPPAYSAEAKRVWVRPKMDLCFEAARPRRWSDAMLGRFSFRGGRSAWRSDSSRSLPPPLSKVTPLTTCLTIIIESCPLSTSTVNIVRVKHIAEASLVLYRGMITKAISLSFLSPRPSRLRSGWRPPSRTRLTCPSARADGLTSRQKKLLTNCRVKLISSEPCGHNGVLTGATPAGFLALCV